MDVKGMHYNLALKLNKVDSLQYANFQPGEIDEYLNEAQWIFIKTRYGINNIYKTGFEGNSKRIKDLQNLVVEGHETPLVPNLYQEGIYYIDLDVLSRKPYIVVNAYASTKKGTCQTFMNIKEIQHDDLSNIAINYNENTAPSFIWRYLPAVYREKNRIYLYTNNDFDILEVYLDYIRQPKEIRYGSYGGFAQQDCEIGTPDSYPEHYEILNIAEKLIKVAIEHPGLQASQLKDLITE